MTARNLAVVPPGTKARPKKRSPMNVKTAADHSERALLVALRDRIAKDIDAGVPPAYLAPLARQIREIDREIRSIDARAKEESVNGDTVPDEAFDASAL